MRFEPAGCYARSLFVMQCGYGESTHSVKVDSLPTSRNTRPDNRRQPHLRRHRPNAIIDIAIRRPERVGRHTRHVLDDLFRPTQLRNDLLIGQSRQGRVGPCVHRELVARHVLCLDHFRARNDARADEEKGGLELLLVQVVQEERSVRGGSVVERGAPGALVGTLGDVCLASYPLALVPCSPCIDGILLNSPETAGIAAAAWDSDITYCNHRTSTNTCHH